MPILRIDHAVRDFDLWKQAFDNDPVGREAGGVRHHRIARASDDRNYVIIELEFETMDEAETFSEKLRQLWSEAGPRLGLENPSARIIDVVESKDY